MSHQQVQIRFFLHRDRYRMVSTPDHNATIATDFAVIINHWEQKRFTQRLQLKDALQYDAVLFLLE